MTSGSTFDVPGVQARAVGAVDEKALDRGCLRERRAARFVQPLRVEDEAVLREVHEEGEPDREDQGDLRKREQPLRHAFHSFW